MANLTLLIRVTVVYNDVIRYPRAAWQSAARELRARAPAMASVVVRSAIAKVLARQDLFIGDDKAKVIQRDVERLLEVMKGQDSFSERLLTIFKSTFVPRYFKAKILHFTLSCIHVAVRQYSAKMQLS